MPEHEAINMELLAAVQRNDTKAVLRLLDQGAEPNTSGGLTGSASPLLLALAYNPDPS